MLRTTTHFAILPSLHKNTDEQATKKTSRTVLAFWSSVRVEGKKISRCLKRLERCWCCRAVAVGFGTAGRSGESDAQCEVRSVEETRKSAARRSDAQCGV
ncbi:hypothetical protein NDU88_002623 [Pleurodeles waltl]|uniref:Uncharacterized protein n=1 Tax=Pleurodeles waltl TaxID=8319 RepID=A0AAV7VB23_PLEWA|nr:hypothetical protein NDU88_002623 [Pleurodeles waltl]